MKTWIKPVLGHHATDCKEDTSGPPPAYRVFSPEELEERLVAYQEMVDAARNRGELLEGEPTYTVARAADMHPGFEKSPRGISLGAQRVNSERRIDPNCPVKGLVKSPTGF